MEPGQPDQSFADAGFAARCLLRQVRWATLATQSLGQPFASLVTQAVAPDGAVLMLLSALAEHSRHLSAEPRCALMVAGAPADLNWHSAARVTVTGRAVRLDDRAARAFWTARHPYARLYAEFTDFSIWRLVPEAGMFIAGFGRIVRLQAGQLACPADAVLALAGQQAELLAVSNRARGEEASRLAHLAGRRGQWQAVGIDPDGMDLTQDDDVLRIAFAAMVRDAEAARAAIRFLLA